MIARKVVRVELRLEAKKFCWVNREGRFSFFFHMLSKSDYYEGS